MSDTVQVAIVVAIFLFLLTFIFRDELKARIKSGSSIDARAKFPAGIEGQFSLGSP